MKYKYALLITIFVLFMIQCLWMLICDLRFENVYTLLNSLKINKVDFSTPTISDSDDFVACKMLDLNPWDPLILSNIVHPKDLYCKKEQPFFSYVDFNGYLRINRTEANIFLALNKTFSCFYWTFDRDDSTVDSIIHYDEKRELREPVRLSKDHVKVRCFFISGEDVLDEFYFNLHAHPSPERLNRFNSSAPTEDQLSVLIYVIDSVSHSVLQRNLPLTFNYTTNVMGFKYFKGFNKVGDNSFPNWMAMLMGKRVVDEQDDMPREMTGDYSKIQYDAWPFVWKRFADKGYLTVFNEDNPQVGLFHFEAKGFRRKPVDYYYHIFWHAVQAESNHDYICFQNEPKSRMIMDLTKRHLAATRDRLQFMITSTMELSHDSDNQVELTDDDLMVLWKNLYENGYLNETAVIFASDHGLRLGNIRTTLIGLLEERLPFFGIWFPSWFYDKHPRIKRNLENNLNILSSHFDVYETLTDILNANYDGSQRDSGRRGQSQLYPLPKNRTCKEAGIPDHYCTCSMETFLAFNDTLVEEAAAYLVDHLNELLSNVSGICHRIELKKVLFAKLVDINGKVKQGVHNVDEVRRYEKGIVVNPEKIVTKDIRIGVETAPKGGLFDALLRKATIDGRQMPWKVVGSVSRSNKYRGYSDCVDDKYFKKICTCKNL